MTDGLYALVGVLVGTVATAGPQLWDRFRGRKRADEQATSEALAELLNALWGRMALNVKATRVTAEQRRSAHTAWVHARNRFGATSLKDRFHIVDWLDLELMHQDHKPDTTWHNIDIRHGHLTQFTVIWIEGEDRTRIDNLNKRHQDLKARYRQHTHA